MYGAKEGAIVEVVEVVEDGDVVCWIVFEYELERVVLLARCRGVLTGQAEDESVEWRSNEDVKLRSDGF